MTETDLAWAAGFIDGEGSINVVPVWVRGHKRSGLFRLQISVSGTVRKPLERLQSLFGGNIQYYHRAKEVRKDYWQWFLYGKKAQDVLKSLYNQFTVKTRQAAIAEVFPIKTAIGGSSQRRNRHPLAVILQEECYKAMKISNHRGSLPCLT